MGNLQRAKESQDSIGVADVKDLAQKILQKLDPRGAVWCLLFEALQTWEDPREPDNSLTESPFLGESILCHVET